MGAKGPMRQAKPDWRQVVCLVLRAEGLRGGWRARSLLKEEMGFWERKAWVL